MRVGRRKPIPAKVEAAIMRRPGVPEAAAIGLPDELEGAAIVAYVVTRRAVVGPPGSARDRGRGARAYGRARFSRRLSCRKLTAGKSRATPAPPGLFSRDPAR